MTVFIDTAVIMYAAGGDHPLRDPSRRVLSRVGVGEVDGVISAEVIQEILRRFISIRRPEIGRDQATDAMDFFGPVLPITHAVMRRVPDLVMKYPSLDARDLVHVATCINEGITTIASPDCGFDQVAEIRRIDPAEFADASFDPA